MRMSRSAAIDARRRTRGDSLVDQSQFTFTPDDNGTYVAKVTITDDDGASVDLHTADITVTNVNPSGTITGIVTADDLVTMITDPDIDYTTTPANLMKHAEFMHRVGRMKRLPASWKDLFFAEAHDLQGS